MDTAKFNEAMVAAGELARSTGEKHFVFRIPPDDENLYIASTSEIDKYPGSAHAILGECFPGGRMIDYRSVGGKP